MKIGFFKKWHPKVCSETPLCQENKSINIMIYYCFKKEGGAYYRRNEKKIWGIAWERGRKTSCIEILLLFSTSFWNSAVPAMDLPVLLSNIWLCEGKPMAFKA